MTVEPFEGPREFKAWNDAMVRKYDLELFHEHPSRLIRWVEGARIERIMTLLAAGPRDRIVDVGCGAGHLLARLQRGRAFGLDLSEYLLAKTVRRIGRDGVVVQGDAERLPFRDRSCDRVFCSEVLEHVPDPGAVMSEIGRVLGPGGVAVVSVPNERHINRWKTIVRRSGLARWLLSRGSGAYEMPERMDDEWHLHTFDLGTLLRLVPDTLCVATIDAVPLRWLPIHYIVSCRPADHASAPGKRTTAR